mmetsp:Transcript_370/g.1304  ORF Transcript_370/g.1304 Transcript_370/m.1304 type:complete len:254 (-) Transcript_370:812-1573(-)
MQGSRPCHRKKSSTQSTCSARATSAALCEARASPTLSQPARNKPGAACLSSSRANSSPRQRPSPASTRRARWASKRRFWSTKLPSLRGLCSHISTGRKSQRSSRRACASTTRPRSRHGKSPSPRGLSGLWLHLCQRLAVPLPPTAARARRGGPLRSRLQRRRGASSGSIEFVKQKTRRDGNVPRAPLKGSRRISWTLESKKQTPTSSQPWTARPTSRRATSSSKSARLRWPRSLLQSPKPLPPPAPQRPPSCC